MIVMLASHFSLEVGGAGGGGGGGIHSIRESMAVGPDWATADLSRQALGCLINNTTPMHWFPTRRAHPIACGTKLR
jgi:hypothetical protein